MSANRFKTMSFRRFFYGTALVMTCGHVLGVLFYANVLKPFLLQFFDSSNYIHSIAVFAVGIAGSLMGAIAVQEYMVFRGYVNRHDRRSFWRHRSISEPFVAEVATTDLSATADRENPTKVDRS